MANTPNMQLPSDVPSVTTGPQWATDLETMKGLIDAHSHVSGQGLQIPTAGLSINANLPFGGNLATGVAGIGLNAQATTQSGTLFNTFQQVGGNLYWNNAQGVPVQLTAANGPATTASGVTGLAGTSAAITYSAALSTFIFTSAATLSANLDAGTVTLRQPGVANAPGISLAHPLTTSGAYTAYWPVALPSAGSGLMTLDQFGNMGVGSADPIVQNVNVSGIISASGFMLGAFPLANVPGPTGSALTMYQESTNLLPSWKTSGGTGYPVSPVVNKNTTSGTAFNAVTETILAGGQPSSVTKPNKAFFVPANSLSAGSVIRLTAIGAIASSNTVTLTLNVRGGPLGTVADPVLLPFNLSSTSTGGALVSFKIVAELSLNAAGTGYGVATIITGGGGVGLIGAVVASLFPTAAPPVVLSNPVTFTQGNYFLMSLNASGSTVNTIITNIAYGEWF